MLLQRGRSDLVQSTKILAAGLWSVTPIVALSQYHGNVRQKNAARTQQLEMELL